MRIRFLLMTLCEFLVASATAATLTVNKDGTGDFSVIQRALDVAADGDTILIGPGEYSESTMVRMPGWTYDVESFAHLQADNLTIIGAGSEATIIGPTIYKGSTLNDSPAGLSYAVGGRSLHISDVCIRHCCAAFFGGVMYMDRCWIANNRDGLVWDPIGPGGWVRDSVIEVTETIYDTTSFRIGTAGLGSGIELERCTFGNPASIGTVQGAVMRQCILAGLSLNSQTSATLDACTSIGAVYGISLRQGTGIRCEVLDSHLQGQVEALFVEGSAPGGSFVVENSRLEGGSDSVIHLAYNAGACAIHHCDLIKGSVLAVHCTAGGPLTVHDFTNNYWGATSEAQIDAWIFDHSDNGLLGATVLYVPFAGQSVPAESTSWGNLKSMFR